MTPEKRVIRAGLFILLFAFTATSASALTSREYPYFYKSARALGMGGAFVAVGGTMDTLFYNPAGLSHMPENDMEVSILKPQVDLGSDAKNIVDDIKDSLDTGNLDGDLDGDASDDQIRAFNDVAAKYQGELVHVNVSNFSTTGRNNGKIAWGVGHLARARVEFQTHQGFGSDGILETNSELMHGPIMGMSFRNLADGLSLGFALKYFQKDFNLEKTFTATELLEHEDDLENYILEDLKESGGSFGFDLGTIYEFAKHSPLKPSVGFSLLNIGGMNFSGAGKIPMTANLGFALRPEITPFESAIFGFDFVDLFFNQNEDHDYMKRVRLGGELTFVDKKLIAFTIRTGLYQGYFTYGADLRLSIFEFSFLSYREEIGGFAGQKADHRSVFMLNIGW